MNFQNEHVASKWKSVIFKQKSSQKWKTGVHQGRIQEFTKAQTLFK